MLRGTAARPVGGPQVRGEGGLDGEDGPWWGEASAQAALWRYGH